jgi:hypothetical protein
MHFCSLFLVYFVTHSGLSMPILRYNTALENTVISINPVILIVISYWLNQAIFDSPSLYTKQSDNLSTAIFYSLILLHVITWDLERNWYKEWFFRVMTYYLTPWLLWSCSACYIVIFIWRDFIYYFSPRECFETGHIWAHACHVKLGRKYMSIPPHQQSIQHSILATTTAWRMVHSVLPHR